MHKNVVTFKNTTYSSHNSVKIGKSSQEDMSVTGQSLFGSSEHLATVRYYDDDVPKKTFNSSEELHEDADITKQENKPQIESKSRKLARDQIWRNLSQPKHPKTSLKQLREKIEADIKKESWSKYNSLPRVQTLPVISPEGRGLIANADRNNRSNKSMYLTVPNTIHTSRSDDNLVALDPNPATFETQEVIKLDPPSGRQSPLFPGNGLTSLPSRRRAKSLVINSDHRHESTTGNQIDLRLLLPPRQVANERARSISDSAKGTNIIIPELRVDSSDWFNT